MTGIHLDLDQYHRIMGLVMRVELALFAIHNDKILVLMLKRDQPPFENRMVLPGASLHDERSAEGTADGLVRRMGLSAGALELFCLFSEVERDPRARVLSAGYRGSQSLTALETCARQSTQFELVEVSSDGLLIQGDQIVAGFDHARMVFGAISHMRRMLDSSFVAFDFLPPTFTLLDLQRVHEAILGNPLAQMTFRKRMLARVFHDGSRLIPTGEFRQDGGRPARLFARKRPDTG